MFTENEIKNYVCNRISELDTRIRNESNKEFKKYMICRINELARLREYFCWDDSKEDDINLDKLLDELES